jgi:hypothetical protein
MLFAEVQRAFWDGAGLDAAPSESRDSDTL